MLPGLAETDRQSHSLTPRGSEGAFAFVWAQVSEHHQAVLPEGRRDPGDVRHHGRVLLPGGAELDEQRPGESGTWAPVLLVLPCSNSLPGSDISQCPRKSYCEAELSKQMPVLVSLESEALCQR